MVCLGCGLLPAWEDEFTFDEPSLSVIFESFLQYNGLLESVALPAFGVVRSELDVYCMLLAIVEVAFCPVAVFELVVWAAVPGRLSGELLAPMISVLREFLVARLRETSSWFCCAIEALVGCM